MSEFKGTKGKWDKIHTMGNNQDKDCFYKIIKNSKGLTIAEAKGVHYGIKNEECIANAKLISCAPEMLEMLKEVSEEMKNEGYPELLSKVNHIIKKATTL